MSCWCGHGPWHHHGYSYPAQFPPPGYPPPGYPPPGYLSSPAESVGRRRGRGSEVDELADQLEELAEQMARIRQAVDELRPREAPES